MRRIKKRPVIGLDYKCHHFRRANDTCSVVTIFVKKHWGNLILNELQELINSFQINEVDLLQRLKNKIKIKETKKFSKLQKTANQKKRMANGGVGHYHPATLQKAATW